MAWGFVAPQSQIAADMLLRRASPQAILGATKHQLYARHHTRAETTTGRLGQKFDERLLPSWEGSGVGCVESEGTSCEDASSDQPRQCAHGADDSVDQLSTSKVQCPTTNQQHPGSNEQASCLSLVRRPTSPKLLERGRG